MANMTISMPDSLRDWIEAEIRRGDYADASDYLGALVRRDRARQAQSDLSLQDLREIVDDARAGGASDRSVADILHAVRSATRVD